jgi:hypothetical protein
VMFTQVMGSLFQQRGQAAELDRGEIQGSLGTLQLGNSLVFSQVQDLEGAETDKVFHGLGKTVASLVQSHVDFSFGHRPLPSMDDILTVLPMFGYLRCTAARTLAFSAGVPC